MQVAFDSDAFRKLVNGGHSYDAANLVTLTSLVMELAREMDIASRMPMKPEFWLGVGKVARKGLTQTELPPWLEALATHCDKLGGKENPENLQFAIDNSH